MKNKRLLTSCLVYLFLAGFTAGVSGEIYLTADVNMPDPNDEVTIWVYSEEPLFALGAAIAITGDANITTAMCEADCNQYGWDNGWNSDPYIDDANGLLYLSGISWASDANGTVGYFKFIYHSGEVNVSFLTGDEWSIAFSWDGNSCPQVLFSEDVLSFGEPDSNQMMLEGGTEEISMSFQEVPQEILLQGEDQQMMTESESESGSIPYYYSDLKYDNKINMLDFSILAGNWQKTGIGLEGDFDSSGTVDGNDLYYLASCWLVEANWPLEMSSTVLATATITNPVDMAFDPNGLLYVLSSSQSQVKIYDCNLALKSTVDIDADNPKGLAIWQVDEPNARPMIYIVDTGNDQVLRHKNTSAFNFVIDSNFGDSGVIGQTGSADGDFNVPCDIAMGNEGQFCVADSNNDRLQIFEADGSFASKFGSGQLNRPKGICEVGSSIYVMDANNTLQKRSSSGTLLGRFGGAGSDLGRFNNASKISYDLKGDRIVAADTGNNRIEFIKMFSYGSGATNKLAFGGVVSDQSFSSPMAAIASPDLDEPNMIIYVADTGNDRILKLQVEPDNPANRPTAKFASFKSALEANDVNAAVALFATGAAERYTPILEELQPSFTEMASDIEGLIKISDNSKTTTYDIIREENGEFFGYPITFVRDNLGNWKINGF